MSYVVSKRKDTRKKEETQGKDKKKIQKENKKDKRETNYPCIIFDLNDSRSMFLEIFE